MSSRNKTLIFFGTMGVVLVISNVALGDEYERLRSVINLVLVVVLAVSVVYMIAVLHPRSSREKPEERHARRFSAAKEIAERIIGKTGK